MLSTTTVADSMPVNHRNQVLCSGADKGRRKSGAAKKVDKEKCFMLDLEEAGASTTDIGSTSSSDAESTTSRGSSFAPVPQAVVAGAVRTLGRKPRNTKASRGTPLLETIPGTPVASSGQAVVTTWPCDDVPQLPPPRSPRRRGRAQASASASQAPALTAVAAGPLGTVPALPACRTAPDTAAALATTPQQQQQQQQQRRETPVTARYSGPFSTVPTKAAAIGPVGAGERPEAAPESQLKRLREAFMDSARQEGLPLKVQPSGDLWSSGAPLRILDRALPAKKMPSFSDVAGPGPAAKMRSLQPGMPVKKRITSFLVEAGPAPTPTLLVAR